MVARSIRLQRLGLPTLWARTAQTVSRNSCCNRKLPPFQTGLIYSGGSDQVYASNINKTYDEKIYFASYFQDDWKINSKLTLNLGLRWDFFGPINEQNGGQANFVPSGAPDNKPEYLIPASGKDNRSLSASFTDLLAKDGIALVSSR